MARVEPVLVFDLGNSLLGTTWVREFPRASAARRGNGRDRVRGWRYARSGGIGADREPLLPVGSITVDAGLRSTYSGERVGRSRGAELLGSLPDDVMVVGIEPQRIRVGMGLSPAVAASIGPAAERAADFVRKAVIDVPRGAGTNP